jgi:hypothetical protein
MDAFMDKYFQTTEVSQPLADFIDKAFGIKTVEAPTHIFKPLWFLIADGWSVRMSREDPNDIVVNIVHSPTKPKEWLQLIKSVDRQTLFELIETIYPNHLMELRDNESETWMTLGWSRNTNQRCYVRKGLKCSDIIQADIDVTEIRLTANIMWPIKL